MENDKIENQDVTEPKTRRTFVKTAAQVAVTAPAVAMLLTATTKNAAAQPSPYGPGVCLGDTADQGLDGCPAID